MTINPGYGETPLDGDELDALLPLVVTQLGGAPTKAEVFDLEEAIAIDVAARLVAHVLDGAIALETLLTDRFVRELHGELFGDLWQWAGRYRARELTIGVAPERVAEEVRASLETIAYRWQHTNDWNAKVLGATVHAELTRIHPFADGNGRSTRLLADLVYLTAQDTAAPETFDWAVDKAAYIDLLRRYDTTRDARPPASFLGTVELR